MALKTVTATSPVTRRLHGVGLLEAGKPAKLKLDAEQIAALEARSIEIDKPKAKKKKAAPEEA